MRRRGYHAAGSVSGGAGSRLIAEHLLFLSSIEHVELAAARAPRVPPEVANFLLFLRAAPSPGRPAQAGHGGARRLHTVCRGAAIRSAVCAWHIMHRRTSEAKLPLLSLVCDKERQEKNVALALGARSLEHNRRASSPRLGPRGRRRPVAQKHDAKEGWDACIRHAVCR
ncbi:unnamed protein product [Prorocentrum cordatum]|uniref:Uncharacterized protein n=1 Tax=Prorocentrum cordatum TaxID=2364126 RepID=A0ABN9PTK5_9DINO|nr:unnamed protein product [Polarella glacialis]